MFYSVIVCTYVQMKKDGSAVTEMMYRLNIAKKNEKQKQHEAFHQIILDKKQELKQQQEALILKTMDEISKHEKVMQIKVLCFYFFSFSYISCAYLIFDEFKKLIEIISGTPDKYRLMEQTALYFKQNLRCW